jgi:hypothetical protein
MAAIVLLTLGSTLSAASPTEVLDTAQLSGALSRPRPIERGHRGKGEREGELPKFDYYLDESDPDIPILRREDGTFVAAFSAEGATREGIVEAAMEDYQEILRDYRARQEKDTEE